MAFSLRLPPELDRAARMRADQVGVTLNGFICFALDAYLRGLASDPARASAAAIQPAKPDIDTSALPAAKTPPVASPAPLLHPPGPNASKAERRAFTENQRLQRKGRT